MRSDKFQSDKRGSASEQPSTQIPPSTDQSSAGTPRRSLRITVHDLRNSLNVIRNAAYLLRRKLVAGGGENVDLVDMIEESVKGAESVAIELSRRAADLEASEQSGADRDSKG